MSCILDSLDHTYQVKYFLLGMYVPTSLKYMTLVRYCVVLSLCLYVFVWLDTSILLNKCFKRVELKCILPWYDKCILRGMTNVFYVLWQSHTNTTNIWKCILRGLKARRICTKYVLTTCYYTRKQIFIFTRNAHNLIIDENKKQNYDDNDDKGHRQRRYQRSHDNTFFLSFFCCFLQYALRMIVARRLI